jgi:TonB family protein
MLGSLYEMGLGAPRDYAQAALWFRKSADQGYGLAQNNLAELYDRGLGVARDPAEAAKWRQKAVSKPSIALPPPPPSMRLISNPDWSAKPAPGDVDRVYPSSASSLGAGGEARLSCSVATAGTLTSCSVQSEEPTDQGFGEAALKLAPLFTMRAKSLDGQPTSGGMVIVPITFGAGAAAGLVKLAGLPCTITDSRFIIRSQLANGVKASFHEVACQEGLGWVVISRSSAPMVDTQDCLSAGRPSPTGTPSFLSCTLAANLNPTAALTPLMTKTGRDCTVDKARAIGTKSNQAFFEVACQDGAGFVLQVPRASGGVLKADSCLALDQASAAVKCELTTAEQRAAVIDRLVADGGKPCAVKSRRYIGATADHTDVVEVACTEGGGYVMQIDHTGKLKSEVDCIHSADCKLTDTGPALARQNSAYGALARAAGFDCEVSRYADYPVNKPGLQVVELQCSNRPDGGVGIFQAGAKGRVVDCVRAQTEGYRCALTKEETVYPALTAQLMARGKGSCVVSGARGAAHTLAGEELVEVACANGAPGWVLDYPPNALRPGSLLNCSAMAKSAAPCALPTNLVQR